MTIRILKPAVTGLAIWLGAAVAMGQADSSNSSAPYAKYYADDNTAYAGDTAPAAPGATEGEKAPAEAAAPDKAAGDCGCQSSGDSCHILPIIKVDDCCPLTCDDVKTWHLQDDVCLLKNLQDDWGTTVNGWVDGGIEGNSASPSSHFNGPVAYPDQDSGQLNQGYVFAERTAPADNCGLFVGGRVDLLWGSDYIFNTAAGLDGRGTGNTPRWGNSDLDYGLAMPQLYAEVDYDKLKFKIGHFYTTIGNEVSTAKDNFFYSHSYMQVYGEPATHTGVLAGKTVNDNWAWTAGLVTGWNTFDTDDRAQFLGGLTYTQKDWGTLAFNLITGDDSTENLAGVGPFANRTMFSLVWTRNFTSRWTYVLQYDYGFQDNADTVNGANTARWYGLNQYLFYKINCCWTFGARFEWFRDSDGFVVTGLRPGNPVAGNFFAGNFYEATVGFNYKPTGNLSIRPEIRYDWFDSRSSGVGSQNPYNDNQSDHQFLYGIDAIYQF